MTIDIAEARALCEAASAEWFLYAETEVGLPVGLFCRDVDDDEQYPVQDSPDDLEFAVAARTLLPEALDEIERLRKALAEARDPKGRATTHAEGCWAWRHHHECAIAEIERLRTQVAELKERLAYLDSIGLERGLKE